jgi:ABC-type branched-subunit amino acid transport system substrate-binding protein
MRSRNHKAIGIALAAAGLVSAALGGHASASSDEPIRLGSVLTINSPIWSNGAVEETISAWVEFVNAEGGINGRSVEYEACDDEGDPGRSLQCTQDLIDSGVVAFVGNASLAFGPNALPTAEEAGVPSIGGYPISPPEFQSELNFPTTAGASGSYPSLAVYLAAQGAKSVTYIGADTPPSRGVADNLEALWPELGGEEFSAVFYDASAADFVPTATQVAGDSPDGVIVAAAEGPGPRLYQALQVVGYDGIITGTSQGATEAAFATAGDAMNGVIFSIPTLPATLEGNEDVDLFNQVMDEYAPDVERGAAALVAASSIQYLVDVMKAVDGDVTSESIREVLDAASVRPFLVHSLSSDQAPEGMPRVWNPYNAIVQYDGESLQLIGDEAEESDYVSKELGVTWFAGNKPAGS